MSAGIDLTILIDELFEKSEALLAHIKTAAENTVYDDLFIERIQELVNARQATIDQMDNEAGRQNVKLKEFIGAEVSIDRCQYLVNMEKEIADGLKYISGSIQNSRQLFQKKQRSRQQYRNPFGSVQRDGMFVDKRK
jgi:hypothetical protein